MKGSRKRCAKFWDRIPRQRELRPWQNHNAPRTAPPSPEYPAMPYPATVVILRWGDSLRPACLLFRLIGTCLPCSSLAFPPDDRGKLAPDPTKEGVAEDSDAEHCGEQRHRFETFAPFPLPVHVPEIELQRELIQCEGGAHSVSHAHRSRGPQA